MSNASIRESPQPAEAAISGSQLVTKTKSYKVTKQKLKRLTNLKSDEDFPMLRPCFVRVSIYE